MSNYENWKKEYISKDASRKYLSDKQIREVYNSEVSSSSEIISSSKSTSSSSTNSASLLSHRNFLRETTAYPVLRKINLLSAIVIVVLSIVWGLEVDESVAIIFGAIGIVVATLSYSITSVFYDVADSTINISKNSD
jgi:hypothetical protein